MSIKNSMTPSGMEPATFRFVAQHLNHCATAVPYVELYGLFKDVLLKKNGSSSHKYCLTYVLTVLMKSLHSYNKTNDMH